MSLKPYCSPALEYKTLLKDDQFLKRQDFGVNSTSHCAALRVYCGLSGNIIYTKFYQITYCTYSSAPELDNPRLTEFTNNLVDFG